MLTRIARIRQSSDRNTLAYSLSFSTSALLASFLWPILVAIQLTSGKPSSLFSPATQVYVGNVLPGKVRNGRSVIQIWNQNFFHSRSRFGAQATFRSE